jgi:hypothetical protein
LQTEKKRNREELKRGNGEGRKQGRIETEEKRNREELKRGNGEQQSFRNKQFNNIE